MFARKKICFEYMKNTIFLLVLILEYIVCKISVFFGATLIWCNKKSNEVSILLGGDVPFGGLARYLVKNHKCRYEDALLGIKSETKNTDLFFVNLENSIANPNKPPKPVDPDKDIRLIAESDSIKALLAINVTGVSLGNNHLMDNGIVGVKNTMRILKKNNIKFSGVTYGKRKYNTQKAATFDVNGIKVGMLSYCMDEAGCEKIRTNLRIGTALFQRMFAIKDHADLKKKVDVILTYVHWQEEYTNQPTNMSFVRGFVDAVSPYTDVVVGSHQHVTSGHYYVRNTLVLNGLGNLYYPMHLTPFNEYEEKKKPPKKFERWWYKLTKTFTNPSAQGKLVRVSFNKSGLIRSKAEYEFVNIIADEKHCLKTVKDNESKWKRICGKGDDECYGDTKCNPHECDI